MLWQDHRFPFPWRMVCVNMCREQVDSTMDLITNGESESSYETILGKKLEELKEDWLRSVDAMEQKYTWEEIVEMEQEYLADLQQ